MTEYNLRNGHGDDLAKSDDTVNPPFAALDRLANEIAWLDEWTSAFVGRMQPYSTATIRGAGEPVKGEDATVCSALESRIGGLTGQVAEIRAALVGMGDALRL